MAAFLVLSAVTKRQPIQSDSCHKMAAATEQRAFKKA